MSLNVFLCKKMGKKGKKSLRMLKKSLHIL